MATIWKPIKGLEGLVEISNDYRFKRVERIQEYTNGRKEVFEERIFPAYRLDYRGKRITFKIRIFKKFYCFHYERIVREYFKEFTKESEIVEPKKEINNVVLKKVINDFRNKFKITNPEILEMKTGEAKICAKIMEIDFELLCDAICTVR